MRFSLFAKNSDADERGSIFVLLAFAVVTLLGLVGMMVDQGRQEISLTEIQACADAASLAGARMYDTTPSGWRNAKRAALQVVKQCNVRGTSASLANLTPSTTAPDSLEPADSPFASNDGTSGDFEISVQRGLFRQKAESPDAESPEFEFIRLDSLEKLEDAPAPFFEGVPILSIANAVKVDIHMKNFATTIARAVLHNSNLGTLGRSSVAVSDQNIENCVAPIAIPACSLFLNTQYRTKKERRDPSTIYDTASFDASRQCAREVVASEADTEVPQRWDGIARSQWYPRPPYYRVGQFDSEDSDGLNRDALPIRAVLGVPDAESGEATPKDVADHLIRFARGGSGSCIKARLGMNFRPLNSLFKVARDESGLPVSGVPVSGIEYLVNNAELDDALARAINSGVPFSSAFPAPAGPNVAEARDSNYPYLRHYLHDDMENPNKELRLSWPESESQGGLKFGQMYLQDMGDIKNYVNPLCHSSKVLNPNNPDKANVAKVRVMLIAPSDDSVDYCDFKNIFNGDKQNSIAPTSKTAPRVIGFLDANFFDFNFRDLTQPKIDGVNIHYGTPDSPVFKDAGGDFAKDIVDANPRAANPQGLDMEEKLAKSLADYRDKLLEYQQCRLDALKSAPAGSCPCYDTKADAFWSTATSNAETTCREQCWTANGIYEDYSQCGTDGTCPVPMPIVGNPALCNPLPSAYAECQSNTYADYVNQMFAPTMSSCVDDLDREAETGMSVTADPTQSTEYECARPEECRPPRLPPSLKDRLAIEDDDQGELDECLALCPTGSLQDCPCIQEMIPASDSSWEKTCFKRFDGKPWKLPRAYKDLGLPKRGSWTVHPIFAEPFRSAFWEAPSVYYRELSFIANIIREPIPSLNDVMHGGDEKFNEMMDTLERGLNARPLSRRPLYTKFLTHYMRWRQGIENADVPMYFGDIEPGYFSRSPEENSALYEQYAHILGEDLDTRGIPVSPVIPGTAASDLLADSQTDLIAKALTDLDHLLYEKSTPDAQTPSLVRNRWVALPGQHCLPMKLDNRFPVSDPDNWQQPADRSPQYGCGGMRIRLSCNSSSSFTSPANVSNRRPALVREN